MEEPGVQLVDGQRNGRLDIGLRDPAGAFGHVPCLFAELLEKVGIALRMADNPAQRPLLPDDSLLLRGLHEGRSGMDVAEAVDRAEVE